METYFEKVIMARGLSAVTGECVHKFTRLILPNATFLEMGDRDLSDIPLQIAIGLSKCSCSPDFANIYKNLAVDFRKLNYDNIVSLRGRDINHVTTLEVIEAICDEAKELYDDMARDEKWKTSNRGGNAFHIDNRGTNGL